jgi:hypothetical protein
MPGPSPSNAIVCKHKQPKLLAQPSPTGMAWHGMAWHGMHIPSFCAAAKKSVGQHGKFILGMQCLAIESERIVGKMQSRAKCIRGALSELEPLIGPVAAHGQKYPIPTQPYLMPLPPAAARNPPSTSAFRTFGPLPPGWRFIKTPTKHPSASRRGAEENKVPGYVSNLLTSAIAGDIDRGMRDIFPALACCSRVLPSRTRGMS